MLKRETTLFFAGLITDTCKCNDPTLEHLMDENNNNNNLNINDTNIFCPVIKRIAFLMSHQNSPKDIDELIEIFNEEGYIVTNLMDDVFHLVNQHKLEADSKAHSKIKKYIMEHAQINECINDDCDAMQRHCRKSLINLENQ
eukprot:353860_1